MKHPVIKNKVAGSVTIALLGASVLVSNPVLANDIASPFQSVTNNQDPAAINSDQDSLLPPITVRTPAGETKVELGGYVRGSFIYDTEDDLGDSFVVSSIPTSGGSGNGHFRAHAKQSRLRIRSTTERESGTTIKTHLEGDFFGAGGNESFSNSTALRLRHAYLTVGKWTFGQTWTNFMDFVAYPGTVDFFGPAGKSFKRQGQIRYTMDNGLSFSIENPETDGFGAAGRLGESRGGIGSDVAPDITAAWRGGPGGAGGDYEFAAIVRTLGAQRPEIRDADTGAIIQTAIDETVGGGGVLAAGAWDLGFGTFAASFVTGDGIGSYIINGAGNDVFLVDDNNLDSISASGGSVSYNHKWNENATSLIAVGVFDNDDNENNNGIDNLQTVHLNYIWNAPSGVNYGVEAIVGNNETTDGNSGTATRFAFGAQFNF